MKRRTAVSLGCGIGVPVLAGTIGSSLLRRQSAKVRKAYAADTMRPDTRELCVVDRGRTKEPEAEPWAEDLPALAVIGDSWLAGLGVSDPARRPGRMLAAGLAAMTGSPVRLMSTASPSAQAEDVLSQVSAVLGTPQMRKSRDRASGPRYAVLAMGSADIVHPVAGTIGVPVFTTALNRLQREGGYTVIVLTCPNLGRIPGTPQPLRTVLRRSSRVLAGSQWVGALSSYAIPLLLNDMLSGTSHMDLLDVSGRFPSELGYAQISAAVLNRIAEDLELPAGLTPRRKDEEESPAEVDPGPASAEEVRGGPEEPGPTDGATGSDTTPVDEIGTDLREEPRA